MLFSSRVVQHAVVSTGEDNSGVRDIQTTQLAVVQTTVGESTHYSIGRWRR